MKADKRKWLIKIAVIFALLSVSKKSLAQSDTTAVKFINPSAVNRPKGYSQAAQIDLGSCKMLIISGQVAFDSNGNLVGKGDFSEQAEQVFRNIKSIVESAGGSMNNVVKLGFYLVDIKQIQALRGIRDKFFNPKEPPTSTLVEVSKLFRDDVLVEIEAIAIIPVNKKVD